MAVRVHVLRTCDRCGRPVETDGAVPIQQLKQGDTIPVFQRAVLRVIREEPSMDGSAPTVKVFGEFTDLCDPCGNVIDRALETLLKRHSEDEPAVAATPEAGGEPKRKRAGRPPKTVAPDMPGPHGPVVPDTIASSATEPAMVSSAGPTAAEIAAAEAEAEAEAIATADAVAAAAGSDADPF
jgi:hypothetical protein